MAFSSYGVKDYFHIKIFEKDMTTPVPDCRQADAFDTVVTKRIVTSGFAGLYNFNPTDDIKYTLEYV